jgi:hypothetical protein
MGLPKRGSRIRVTESVSYWQGEAMLALVMTTMLAAMPGARGLNQPNAGADRAQGAAVPSFARHSAPNRANPWVFPNQRSNSVENPNNPDR